MKRTHNPGTWILFSFLNQVLFKVKNQIANSALWEELGDREHGCITCWALSSASPLPPVTSRAEMGQKDVTGRGVGRGCTGDEDWSDNLGILSALQYWKCLILFKYESDHIHVHTESPSYLTPINLPPAPTEGLHAWGNSTYFLPLPSITMSKNLSILPSLERVVLSHLHFQKLKITFKSWFSQEACMVGIGSWVVPLSEGGVNCVSTNHIQTKSASRSHHCSWQTAQLKWLLILKIAPSSLVTSTEEETVQV